jgi:hypothetical protein
MAFGGAPTTTVLGPNKLNFKAATLAARAGAAAVAAADTGGLTTNTTTTPANYNTLPATFGPGEGNWTQADVDAVVITSMNGSDQNSFVDYSKTLVAGNLDVVVHSIGSAAVAATNELFLDASHTATR